MMNQETTRLQKLKQRHADLQQKIRREQQKLARSENRLETRRKILAGAVALAEAETEPTWKQRLWARLDHELDRDADRQLFALPLRDSVSGD